MRALSWFVSLSLCLLPAAPAQQMRYRDVMFGVDVRHDFAFHWVTNRHTRRVDQLELDLYQPSRDPADVRAAVVVVHGGGFTGGDKRDAGPALIALDLASRGFVTVSIDYRLAPSGQGAELADVVDATEDFREAVRWLRRNAWWLHVDPDRIGCIGNSAGAVICCQAAYVANGDDGGDVSADIQAVVDLWGYVTSLDAVDSGEVPVHIVHGTNDEAVPFVFSTLLEERARAVGVVAELRPIEGAGHEPWQRYFDDFHSGTVGALYEHLGLGRLAGLEVDVDGPGRVAVRAFGVAGDSWVLLAGERGPDLALDPWGILRLTPASMLAVAARTLPAGPDRLVADALTFAGPPDLAIGSVAWQAFHLRADGRGRLLTNHVETTFR